MNPPPFSVLLSHPRVKSYLTYLSSSCSCYLFLFNPTPPRPPVLLCLFPLPLFLSSRVFGQLLLFSRAPGLSAAYLSSQSLSILKGFLTRDPKNRLGYGPHGSENVMKHIFFKTIDWGKLFRREIKSPFRPAVKSNKCVGRAYLASFNTALSFLSREEDVNLRFFPVLMMAMVMCRV